MTSEDLRSELEKQPYRPLRLHLVSGNAVDVPSPDSAYMLQNAVVLLHPNVPEGTEPGYDVVSLRNIERIEQLPVAADR